MNRVFRGVPIKAAGIDWRQTVQLPAARAPEACPPAEECPEPEPAEIEVGWAWSAGSDFSEDGPITSTFLEPHLDVEFGEGGYADQTNIDYAVVIGSASDDIVWHVTFVEGVDGGTGHPRISAAGPAIVFTWPGDSSYIAGTYTVTPHIDGVAGASITLTVTADGGGGS